MGEPSPSGVRDSQKGDFMMYDELRPQIPEKTRMPSLGYMCRNNQCNEHFGWTIPRVCPKCRTPTHRDYVCGKLPQKNLVKPERVIVVAEKPKTPENDLSAKIAKLSPAQRAIIEMLVDKASQ